MVFHRRLLSARACQSPLKLALLQTNLVLSDKLRLVALLPSDSHYTTTCPNLSSSIGQHYRHSLFHIQKSLEPLRPEFNSSIGPPLNYDLRVRGDEVETDRSAATLRTASMRDFISSYLEKAKDNDNIGDEPSTVAFAMGTEGDDFTPFNTTVGREVAFGAHHAMHHLAMMKVIAEGSSGGLSKGDLGVDFGMAMSSRRHANEQK